MGAWSYIFEPLEKTLLDNGGKVTRPSYAGRPAAASPATGSMKMHIAEQAQLIDDALATETAPKKTKATKKKR